MKPKQKSAMSMERRNALVGISFILPNFIGFLIFVLIPVIFSFILAFMDWDGFTEVCSVRQLQNHLRRPHLP